MMDTGMKLCAALTTLLGTCFLAGCQQPVAVSAPNPDRAVTNVDGLEFSLELPKRQFAVGEQVTVALKAHNTTKAPIAIQSDSRDLVLVEVWDETLVGWEKVKQYPQVSTAVSTPWALAAGQQRTWHLRLTVEPDWPTAKPIRLTAMLNGRPDAAAFLLVRVAPQN